MKFKKGVSICFVVIAVFLGSLHSNGQIIDSYLNTNARLIGFEDGMIITSFLYLSQDAHERYLKKNKTEPQIRCKKCTTKLLGLHELEVGLFAWAIKDGAENKVNFEEIKLTLSDYLKIVSEGSPSETIDYMLRISNETKQFCSDCHCNNDSWEKIA